MKIDTRQAIRMLGEPEDIEDPDDWPDANGKSSRTGGSKKRVDKGTKAAADSDDENEIKIIPSPLTSHQSNVHGRSADLQASAQKPPPKRSLIGSMRDKNGQVVVSLKVCLPRRLTEADTKDCGDPSTQAQCDPSHSKFQSHLYSRPWPGNDQLCSILRRGDRPNGIYLPLARRRHRTGK
jgi:hypothetical protein